jgi:hypothetical protein
MSTEALDEVDHIERLKEVIKIAHALQWIEPAQTSYPLMQLSEVEKCMLAMVSDAELNRMREWYKERTGAERGRMSKTPPTLPDVLDEVFHGYYLSITGDVESQEDVDMQLDEAEAKAAILTAVRQFVVDNKPEVVYKKLEPCEYCKEPQYSHDPDGHFVYAISKYETQLLTALGEEEK